MSEERSGFSVITGDQFDESFLEEIYAIDCDVYPQKYRGKLENYEKRFRVEPRTFVCIKDNASGKAAGYINFLPVNDVLWKDIVEKGKEIRDDDIEGSELVPFEQKYGDDAGDDAGYNLFILSVVILEKFRKTKDAVVTLTDGFRDYLNELNDEGYKIHAIAGTAVSEDGMRFMRERFFYWKREVKDMEEGITDNVFVLEGDQLGLFLEGESYRYKKTYKNDLYMIVPFSCNENGLKGFLREEDKRRKEGKKKVGKEYNKKPQEDSDDAIMTRQLLKDLTEELVYECAPEMTSDIRHYYLGKCGFLFSHDEYPEFRKEDLEEEGDREQTYFYGEETAHLILMADLANKLFNLLIFIPDNKFSPSTAQDQMSQSFLSVRNIEGGLIPVDKDLLPVPHNLNKNKGNEQLGVSDIEYHDLNLLMNHLYGLIPCGQGKTLICASGKPRDEELGCILAGETFNSIHQNFRIRSSVFDVDGKSVKAVYDYYDLYLSERAVVFVEKLKEGERSLFEPEENESEEAKRERIEERIARVTTYTFIMEVVTFRNTALQKISEKVSSAILQDGDVSYTYLQTMYRDFAGSDKYANKRNFKYYGTQREAEAILDAFKTKELEADYNSKQSFLEDYIELSSANRSKFTTTLVGLAATFMSLFGLKEVFGEIIEPFARRHGVPLLSETGLFYKLIVAVFLFYFMIVVILHFRDRKRREEKLIETFKNKFYYLDDKSRKKEGDS